MLLHPTTSSAFRRGAIALATAATITGASMPGASPAAAAPLPRAQCPFMTDRALEMISAFPPHHFSQRFRHSVGGYSTRNYDCSGIPVLIVDKPEDDRGVMMLAKTLYDNHKINLLDYVLVYDPRNIAQISRVLRPNRVVTQPPPELSAVTVGAGPG